MTWEEESNMAQLNSLTEDLVLQSDMEESATSPRPTEPGPSCANGDRLQPPLLTVMLPPPVPSTSTRDSRSSRTREPRSTSLAPSRSRSRSRSPSTSHSRRRSSRSSKRSRRNSHSTRRRSPYSSSSSTHRTRGTRTREDRTREDRTFPPSKYTWKLCVYLSPLTHRVFIHLRTVLQL